MINTRKKDERQVFLVGDVLRDELRDTDHCQPICPALSYIPKRADIFDALTHFISFLLWR